MKDRNAEAIQRAKAVPMVDVLDMLGLPRPDSSHKIRSVFNPDERTPSMHIYPYDWHDFSTGRNGDQIDLVREVARVSFPRAVEMLTKGQYGIRRRREPEPEREVPDLTKKWGYLVADSISTDSDLRELFEVYSLHKWGLGLFQILEAGNVLLPRGDHWQLATPHWHDGKVVGIKYRSDTAKWSEPGSSFREGLYRPRRQDIDTTGDAWLVEGESDAWVMAYQTPAPVFALPSGVGLWRDVWRNELTGTVNLCFDRDEPGEEARERVAGSLMSNGQYTRHWWPVGGNDLGEAKGKMSLSP